MLLPLHHQLHCLVFTYLTTKDYYRLFEFLNDTLVHMQPEVLNIGTFKMFKQSFQIFKPDVLKATRLEDETKLYSKIFVIPIGCLRFCLKVCLYLLIRTLWFLSFVQDVKGTS